MNRSKIKICSIVADIILIDFSGYFIYEAIYDIKQLFCKDIPMITTGKQ